MTAPNEPIAASSLGPHTSVDAGPALATVNIRHDGHVEIRGDITLDDASLAFWDAIAGYGQASPPLGAIAAVLSQWLAQAGDPPAIYHDGAAALVELLNTVGLTITAKRGAPAGYIVLGPDDTELGGLSADWGDQIYPTRQEGTEALDAIREDGHTDHHLYSLARLP